MTSGYDRLTANVASSQLAFYKYIVAPLYSAMDELVPVGQLLSNLAEMRAHWEEVLRQQDSLEPHGQDSGQATGGAPLQGGAMADYITVSGLSAAGPARRRRGSRSA
jgi:hypothetical protein